MSRGRPARAAGPWDKDVLYVLAGAGTAPGDASRECVERLRASLRERGLGPARTVKLTFFVRAGSGAELDRRKRDIAAALRVLRPASPPAVGVVVQPPERGRAVALEAVVLRCPPRSLEIVPRTWRGVPYIVLRGPGGREVIAGGLSGGRLRDLAARTAAAFSAASSILKREGLSFADVVRQWNFVEDITGRSGTGPRARQNYQIFNDIRAKAYDRDDLRSGFPAATGIGTAGGGFVLELIAAAGTAAEKSVPVSNPRQADAHRYSSKVLVGAAALGGTRRRTPKFERARVVIASGAATCYVSGTAAIVGEEVVHCGDVAGQTRATVRNIERLAAPANLRRSGIRAAALAPRLSYVRTYVKHEADIPEVARIVGGAFPGAPALFVEADICRGDLLVEIEGAVDVVTD
jgi:enamine deaminase RidA (YjgF/YER057c/UK114 family)